MLRFTKRADYGLMAMHYIACQTDEGAVSAKRIAEEFSIPPELLAKILQRLAKRKLIVSHNGPKGGYELARPQSEITVGQVVRALEGPVRVVSCLVINKVANFGDQVKGDIRQNSPSIKVKPVDSESDPETAEILTGLIRNIEVQSNAEVAYDTAAESCVDCGKGAISGGDRVFRGGGFRPGHTDQENQEPPHHRLGS